MSLRLKLLLSVVIIVALIWSGVYFLRPVALVTPVVRGKAVNAVPGSVTVDAEYQMDLKSDTSGRIIKSTLKIGAPVAKGDFLVQLDTRDVQLAIEQTQNQIEADKQKLAVGSTIRADYENAKDNLANLERLTKSGNYAEADLEKQTRLVNQIKQRLDLDEENMKFSLQTDETALKVQQLKLERMTIDAPLDGVITAIYARPGDLISPSAPIATIISQTRTVIAKISEENFAGLKVGQSASVRFLGYGDQLYNATVKQVLPTADPLTQRYMVYLDVDLPVAKLVPGLTGEVSIVVGQHDNSLIVPRVALFGGSVYVVSDGQVDLRKVKVGYVSLNDAEILEGVKAGDLVIVDQLDRYRDGERVRQQVWQP